MKNGFKKLIDQRTITSSDVEEFDGTDAFDQASKDIEQRLKIKLHTGFCSQVLKHQLTRHRAQLGEKFLDKIEFYNSSEILERIDLIEKGKMIGEPFTKSQKLKGLRKAYHSELSQAKSILINIHNGTSRKDLERLQALSPSERVAALMTLHTKAIAARKKKKLLTGEWIVFQQHEGKNHYLCLATHEEGKQGDGDAILEKIRPCLQEFPFLKIG